MNWPLVVLVAAGTLGAIDVFYYHLYRLRLFSHSECTAEEFTHLVRHVVFLALLALLASGSASPAVDRAILALFALDIANSAVDVLIERRSRAGLGGLVPGEYLVHVLSSAGMGAAIATYVLARPALPLPPPTGWFAIQVGAMFVVGVALFLIEALLFVQRLARSSQLRSAAVGPAG